MAELQTEVPRADTVIYYHQKYICMQLKDPVAHVRVMWIM